MEPRLTSRIFKYAKPIGKIQIDYIKSSSPGSSPESHGSSPESHGSSPESHGSRDFPKEKTYKSSVI
jgi:hypothetical protein